MAVAWSMVTIFGAYGLRSFPGAEGLANDIMRFAKIVIPAIAAIEQKEKWLSNGSMAVSLQLLLLLGWIVTLLSYFIFWRIVKAVDRKDWIEFRIKLQASKQEDGIWAGSVIVIPLILCTNYFSLLISVTNTPPMAPIAIGAFFVFLIYLGQVLALVVLSRIRGRQ
jgi:formate-dependent nitrite reductase membrane component NrfD